MTIDTTTLSRQALGAAVGATALAGLPPSIARALAIPAERRSGTIEDVDHIVLLMMENRAFDHYFGSMSGVRGFADRFPIPVADSAELQEKTVWYQRNELAPAGTPRVLAPQHNDTASDFALLRNAEHAASLPERAGGLGPRPDGALAAVEDGRLDGLFQARPTCPSSTRWPTPSRCATPTTAA